MSLESKIKTLTAAILALTDQLASPTSVEKAAKPVDPKPEEPAKEVVEKKAKKKKARPDPTKGAPSEDTPSVDDLQSLCLEIVREDRSMTSKIKETIAGFDDAKTIKQVKESDMVALQGLLNTIKESLNA